MKLRTEIHEHEPASGTNDPAQRGRIKDLLMDVLRRDSHERASFIAGETDVFIREEVLRLVAAHDRAGLFMHDPSGRFQTGMDMSADGDELIGSMIGHYQLVRLIGEGGFGRVYLAEQHEPVKRQVALKIIKLGMDTRRVISRFEAERQTLAMMEHPGIARVIDAGATNSGRPYFVMELVQGVPITTYCDEHRLTIDQRLQVFTQLCDAVNYAHMKGIIHRDLKPNNLLVVEHEGRPVTKVIDFGIAKATSARLTDRTLITENRQLLGTPEYMSPEQADFDAPDIDTRADVYSLGVVLFELLTGSTPIDGTRLRSTPLGQMQQFIREHEPSRPSAHIADAAALSDVAHRRSTAPSRLVSQLRGDLDWIVLKAVETDRERRYSSPAELAADLGRCAAHEPVTARPRGVAYLASRFIRRHRAAVVAAMLVAAVVCVGAVLVTASMFHARDSADQTQQINSFMNDMLTSVDPDRGKGADVRLAEVLDQASSSAPERFADHPELEAEIHEVLGKAYEKLALFPQSVSEYRRAVELSTASLGADDPATLHRRVEYISALANAGRHGDLKPLLPDLEQSIERVFGRQHDLWFSVQLAKTHQMSRQGEHVQATQQLEQLSQQAQSAGASEAMQIGILRWLVRARWRHLEATQGAERLTIGEALEPLVRQLVQRSAQLLGPQTVLALEDQLLLARVLEERRQDQAVVETCMGVLRDTTARLGECHSVRSRARGVIQPSLVRLDRADEAATLALQNIACRRVEAPILLVSDLFDALPILDRAGRWSEGEPLARELMQRLQDIGGGHGAMTLDAELYAARFVSLQGRLDEADRLFASLLARETEARDDAHALARMNLCYGAHLVKRARYPEAEQRLKAAADVLGDVRHGTWNIVPDDLILEFMALYQAWDRPDKVAEYQQLREEALHPSMWSAENRP